MRDIAMFLAMLVMVPLALSKSFNAYLLWGWTAMLSPVFYMFGFMQGLRYNLIFAAITIGLWMLGKVDLKGKQSTNTTTVLMIAFTIQVTCSAFLGYDGNPWNWFTYENFIKSVTFALVMPLFVTTRLRLHALVLVICLALGFHGVVEGLKMISTGGTRKVVGIPTTMMSDNNHFAVGMCMLMPILVYVMLHLKSRLGRFAAMAGLGLTLLAVVGTNSRGGFLCLAVLAIWYALTSRRKILASVLVMLLAFIALQIASDSWFDRMESIKTAGQDTSFMGRVIAWKISTAVGLANPIFGGGLHAIQAAPVWHDFMYRIDFLSFISTPAVEGFPRAAHSIYFEIFGDLGVLGFTLFVGLIINAFNTARHIRKLVSDRPDLQWAHDLSDSLRLALIAYCVGGAAVSLGYFELFYVLVMLLEVLKQHLIVSITPQGILAKTDSILNECQLQRGAM
ncbi:MAG: putative O-glycosylation ligase, exosortase A system-associated [Azonexus sp.]|nr:putative O-glycosylation ligase, exosortase A system-associated [Azonexus sp.]